ncbi:acetyl-CoA synthetase-like protein [Epithele typhae]|uniref:acetyl-CoA synthetase-like protein n=1 Tax=Epithele typhae TaxID=378194 RepID=UPI002008C040|nr:acetyl-CoA synthetase-like protein [Epithele typhae]KAH9933970.1 acetyl-CoA synthetase-like protein [Epithele typhae]
MPLTASDVPASLIHEFQRPTEFVNRSDFAFHQLYDWNAVHNPHYPLFVYHDGQERTFISYETANAAMDRAARYALSAVGEKRSVIGVLSTRDSITYYCTVIGLLKAGHTVFLISVRNAPVAVADILQRTGTHHLLVSPDEGMQHLAKESLSGLRENGFDVAQHLAPAFEDLFPINPDPRSVFESPMSLPTKFDLQAPALIMHSSGSTGHPKPISWSHEGLLDWARVGVDCDMDVTGTILGCLGTPMFHALGSTLYGTTPLSGIVLAFFKPAFPTTIPTPDAVWAGTVANHADISFGVPFFIEKWSRDPKKVAHMRKMRGMIFGGAALDDSVGSSLASQGVSLFPMYGLTETGIISSLMRPNPGMDWGYFLPRKAKRMIFRPATDGFLEPVVVGDETHFIAQANTTEDGLDAYATTDLAKPHPTIPGMWKIVGRMDEQIVLSNGEKTNPIPLERIINSDPYVKSSLMFGVGKFQNGVLVEPAMDLAVDPSDMLQVAAFRNKIWPTIERANEFAPQHSRIFKEMILVASPSKPFQFTAKGSLRRNVILKDHHEEIEAIYKTVEESTESDVPPPAVWDEDGILRFVRGVVGSTLGHSLDDSADIFASGGDSLQATWIRNILTRAVSALPGDAAKRIDSNLVFSFPTIAALTNAVHAAISGPAVVTRKPEDLWTEVKRWAASLPARPKDLVPRPEETKDVVVITGTTGGFGCDALEHLLRDERVGRVYAFNRAGSRALARQHAQFLARGLDEALLTSGRFTMVEAKLHEPGFGIDAALLEEIRASVTHIMVNAWTVNFNLTLPSFEADLQGARNFIDFALGSPYTVPPHLTFVSSIGVMFNYQGPIPVPEEPLDDPTSPFGSGYPESKWIIERVFQIVAERTDVKTTVVRLGQVSGDKLGYWNEKEWFPALVKSALHQKCLPDLDGDVAWFNAYEAAQALTEMRDSPHGMMHIVHPRPSPWRALLAPIAAELGVPLVPYTQWLDALEESLAGARGDEVELMRVNPALRIMPFFRAQTKTMAESQEVEPMGLCPLSVVKSTAVSQALASMPMLDGERARAWVAAWRKAGFL